MIIEIKGLPDGQAIKHINVDITFDESGPVVKSTVDTTSEPHSFKQPSQPASIAPTTSQESSVDNGAIPRPVIDTERERKEVPSEMTDMEF